VTVHQAAKLLGWMFLVAMVSACVAGAQTADTNLWITSGTVRAMARLGDTLYVGGNFLRVGPSTGCWVPVDSSTGIAAASYPKVHGVVRCVVSDQAGGWFVGGNFDRVGGTAVRNLAHVLSNGTLSTIPSPDSTVYTMYVQGRTLFLGGEFKTLGTTTRRRLAAIDIPSSSVMSWDPGASRAVYSMSMLANTMLYVGGVFDSLGGVARNRLGVVNGVNGAVGAWAPSATYTYATNNIVRSVVVKDGLVYVGGEFDAIDGITRDGVAALDATTGAPTSWDPGVGATTANVYTILVDTTLVYLGGNFTHMGGQDRRGVVAVDRTTGAATGWEPGVIGNVWCLARSGRTLYVGGSFEDTWGGARDNAAAFDLATGDATPWSPNAAGMVFDIDLDGANVRVAGSFEIVGCLKRRLLAAFDLNTGLPTSWDPGADLPVFAMLATPKRTILVGGPFQTAGGGYHAGLAELDPVTGVSTAWDAGAANTSSPYYPWIQSLTRVGNTLYVGGQFTSIGGQSRKNLAALDLETGVATAWNPTASGPVVAMVPSPGGLLVGGAFGTIGGATRTFLAAIDTATGLATAWNPAPNLTVRALAVRGTTVYVGGAFSFLGGESRSRIGAVNLTTGLATTWVPTLLGGSSGGRGVYTLLPLGDIILVGGDFDHLGGAVRHDLAALEASTGNATSWDPNLSDPTRTSAPTVRALLPYDGRIYAGGDFIVVGSALQVGLASIESPPIVTVGWGDLHWPFTITMPVGSTSEPVYGRVLMAGVTETPNPYTLIEAQLGWGPHGSLPTEPTWTWTPAAFNVDQDPYDEYVAHLTIPVAGTFDYAYRYRYLWSDWTYGDIDGSGTGYMPDQAGVITVTPLITGSILQWPPSVSITLGAATPMIYGRVWGSGITDSPGAGSGLVAQLGYGPDGTDPATSGAWTWVSTAYNIEVDGGGEEYMATLTPTAAGTYDYAYRFSYLGGAWLYSDVDGSANGYQIAQAGALDVAAAGVEAAAPRTLTFALAGANPVRHDASFTLGLPQAGAATLEVFDAAGRQVARVAPGALPVGWHTLRWASAEAAPGLYVVRLRAAGVERVTRLVVLH
jgi:trimeric autotransporter adhesin